MKLAASSTLKGVLAYTEDAVVSTDFIGHPASAIFDAGASLALGDDFVKIVAWYDNEFGYASRMVDMLLHMNKVDLLLLAVSPFGMR